MHYTGVLRWFSYKNRSNTALRAASSPSPAAPQQKIRPSGCPDGPLGSSRSLVLVERPAQEVVAAAATSIFPVHLQQVVHAGKRLVESAVADRATQQRAPLPCALVSVFRSEGVKPRVQIRIRDRFFHFVRHDVDHAI